MPGDSRPPEAAAKPAFTLLLAVALVSAATLAYEVLLTRIFSIVQWHHFAYMIISLALLGYGASGTYLTLTATRPLGDVHRSVSINATLFSLTSWACYLMAQHIQFNALELLWDLWQWPRLLAIYLVLALPFLFAANCVGLALLAFPASVSRVYGVDLLGGGLGAVGVIVLLHTVFPLASLQAISFLALAAAAVVSFGGQGKTPWMMRLAILGAAVAAVVWAPDKFGLHPSPYKGLSQTLQVMGTVKAEERSSPLGLIDVVKSPLVPFRYAPGVSLNNPLEPAEQVGIFTDADAMSVITRFDGNLKRLAYLDQVPSALPYHLLRHPRVLVLGAGGGADVLQALYHGAARIDAVELNAQVIDLVRNEYGAFSGHIYAREEVRVHAAEARGFVAASPERHDLIQVSLLDAFNAAAAGLYALNESHLYTSEALREYLDHLRPDGLLAISRWVRLPPVDGLKLFATASAALQAEGIGNPDRRLAWIRSWKTNTLLIKNGDFEAGELQAIREFCSRRAFDLAYLPDMRPEEANRYNRLSEPYFYAGALALLGTGRDEFLERYKFNVTPATDERPYFFQFFKWRLLPELFTLRGTGGLSLLDLGYLVLIAALLQAVLLSLVLILAPLGFHRTSRRESAGPAMRRQTLIYFFSIGLAFMFIEMAFIQKFVLYLAQPVYAVAVVLAGFLVFAGIGSRAAASQARGMARKTVAVAAAAIGVLCLAYSFLLPVIFRSTLALAEMVKVAIALALIAPLAFFMGKPFPLGLSQLAAQATMLVPWAWGVNGCASVLGSILATLMAIHFGIAVVILAASMLYILAAFACPRSIGTISHLSGESTREYRGPSGGTAAGDRPVDGRIEARNRE
ncbi:MAG: spermidine synthase [Gammaproteobacteria bacterium]